MRQGKDTLTFMGLMASGLNAIENLVSSGVVMSVVRIATRTYESLLTHDPLTVY